MPNVNIREENLTSVGTSALNTNIVYIAGFADWRDNNFDDRTTKAGAYKPKLCSSVSEFEAYFGKHPATFTKEQAFEGFIESAVPTGIPMFKVGDIDPSYVMAKELLAQGLSVVYEAVNTTMDSSDATPKVDKIEIEPTSWSTDYSSYYTKENDEYVLISGKEQTKVPAFAPFTYFSATDSTFKKATKTTFTPIIDFTNVYLKDFPATYTVASDGTFIPFTLSGSTTTRKYAYMGELFVNLLVYGAKGDTGVREVYNNTSELPDGWKDNLSSYFICTVANIDEAEDSDFIALSETYGVASDGVFSQLSTTPTDWETSYYNYFAVDGTIYKNVERDIIIVAPEFSSVSNGVYLLSGYEAGVNVKSIYTAFNTIFDNLADRGEYNIKVITSGGYPTFERTDNVLGKMINLAQTRGDAYVLVDAINNPERTLNPISPRSVYYAVKNSTDFDGEKGKYATMVYPYCNFKRITSDDYNGETKSEGIQLPASYAYLSSMAESLKNNASWLAVAGYKRGVIPNLDSNANNGYYPLCLNETLTTSIADAYQPRTDISICPITYINGAGYCIWGNRTLNRNKDNLTAVSFLNIRNLICDIKKTVYNACITNMFEQDSEILWINFTSAITPLLNKMKTGAGISDYKIIRQTTTEKAKVVATIRIVPVYAVEDWEITISLTDSDVTVE